MTSYYRVRPASRPLMGTFTVPGDKSISHRAILFSALADGPSLLSGLSAGEDNRRTLEAFSAMGATFAQQEGQIAVQGVGLDGLQAPTEIIDCGNSGTTMRLLSGLLSGQPFTSRLDGDASLRRRPMARVAAPLSQMGSAIEGTAGAKPGEIYPPLRVTGRRPLKGLSYKLPTASAQVKSALLLAGLWADGPVELIEPGPSRDHTERMMQALGVPLTVEGQGRIRLDRMQRRGWQGREFLVPGDFSSAAFMIVAALLVPGSRITVRNVGVNPTRTGLLDVLRRMGASLEMTNLREAAGEPVADITAAYSPLHGVEIGGDEVVRSIDEIPILCIAASRAEGRTVVSDAEELRVKESDRIFAMVRELTRLGVPAEEKADGLIVTGPARFSDGVACQASLDHRIAMATTVAGLCAAGPIEVHDTLNVATSFPEFVTLLNRLHEGDALVEEA